MFEQTSKQLMINAYRGEFSSRWPVAPEFWYYFPAKVLGVDMIEFEREVPHWKALQETFKKYNCEGWGIAFPDITNPRASGKSNTKKINDSRFEETTKTSFASEEFTTVKVFDKNQPSWHVKHMADEIDQISKCVDLLLADDSVIDLSGAVLAYKNVGEDFLLEFWLGATFFDFIAGIIGFVKAVDYFLEEEQPILNNYRERYINYQKRIIAKVCDETDFEAFCIGCSYSCDSLLGPGLWKIWDKPYITAIADFIHSRGKLLHLHFHGKCSHSLPEFADTGVDCICPFERPPGGDIDGLDGLKKVRRLLDGRVTVNGNIHTVNTLIRGTIEDVRREIDELTAAFTGSPRLIIGTGDQVGRETKEENIIEMIEYGKRQINR